MSDSGLSIQNEESEMENNELILSEEEGMEEENSLEIEQNGQEQLIDQETNIFQGLAERQIIDFYQDIQNKENGHIQKDVRQEILHYIEQDKNDFDKLTEEIQSNSEEIFQQLYKRIGQVMSSLQLHDGISLIDSKNLTLLNYLINLQLYMLQKISGEKLDQSLVKQLIYDKTLLFKIKPVEKKIDYQINKLLKLSLNDKNDDKQTNDDEGDTLAYKPRPDKLQMQDELSDSDSLDGNKNTSKKYIYQVPKLASTLSKEERTTEKIKIQDKRKHLYLKRKLKKSLLMGEDLNQDDVKELKMTDNPNSYYDKEELEKIRYEEENFVRLPVTKQEKQKRKLRQKMQQQTERLDDMDEMQDIRQLLQYENMVEKDRLQEDKVKIKKGLGLGMGKKRLKGVAKKIQKKKKNNK